MNPSVLSSRALARGALLSCLLSLASIAQAAVTWKDVQFGGFVSQGFLANTGSNDYLGETSEGTFDFREYAANASWTAGKWRLGAQGFGQRLGEFGHDQLTLDWAVVDYQATQWFGVRAGRVKMPRGLYNEALDVDSVRPFVLLPQSVYDARLRDFNAAFNGAMIYGNIALKQAGSVDYRLFYGDSPIATNSGAAVYFNNDLPSSVLSIGMDAVYGGSLFWNTPVNGLRMGYSYSGFDEFGVDRAISFMGQSLTIRKVAPRHDRHLVSAEYTTGDWVFAAEAGVEKSDSSVIVIGLPPSGTHYDWQANYGYASVARRINQHLELGTYVSHSRDHGTLHPSVLGMSPQKQTDYAVSARCDVNEHLTLKLEGHYIDGAGKLFDTPSRPQPLASRDESWFLLAAKATLSF